MDLEIKNPLWWVGFYFVKSRFLLYKNDFKIQIEFKVVVKKGTNKIKSSLQTIDFEYDTINFKIKKWVLITLFDYQYQLKNLNFIYILFYYNDKI